MHKKIADFCRRKQCIRRKNSFTYRFMVAYLSGITVYLSKFNSIKLWKITNNM